MKTVQEYVLVMIQHESFVTGCVMCHVAWPCNLVQVQITKICILAQKKLISTACSHYMTVNFTLVCCKLLNRNMLLKGSKQMEITGLHTANHIYNYWYVQLGSMAGMLGNTTLPRSQYSTQWFPFLWTPWEVPGRQVICNIYCHEATCHLWIQVLNTDFFYSVTQVLMPHWCKYLNVCGDIMEVWRYHLNPMHHIHIKVSIQFSATVFLTLFTKL